MCGIAGIVALPGAPPPEPRRLDAMLDRLVHRGPDGVGRHFDGPVALGARRLAVIDPEGGDQPIFDERREVAVVWNGEIYSHRALRRDLAAAGHAFPGPDSAAGSGGASDGAVIPHLVEDLGADFARRLDGMFAVAVHDARRRTVYLARDPMGIKPLYWTRAGGRLVFASEVPALLAAGGIEPRLDPVALARFLAWEHVPGPRTLFRGVEKLPQGHVLVHDLDAGTTRVDRFWSVPDSSPRPGDPTSDEVWLDAIDHAIRRAVARQLGSDVPLGVLLSGGIDSSLVAAVASEETASEERPGDLDAFTLSLGASGSLGTAGEDAVGYDESPFAREVAASLGLRHHVAPMPTDSERLDALCEEIFGHLADPVADSSFFPTLALCRLARSGSHGVTVVLAGDGGDELFGGYDTHAAQAIAERWQRVPGVLRRPVEALARRLPPRPTKKGMLNKARRFAEGLDFDPRLGHARWRAFADARRLGALLSDDLLVDLPTGEALDELLVAPILRHDARTLDLRDQLVDAYLAKIDRMSMACSLEVRVPLLDLEVVELALRVPERLRVRIRGGRVETKILLRRLAARRLPRRLKNRVVDRPKEGFSAPLKHWLRGSLRGRMETLLAEDRLRSTGLFRPSAIRALVAEHLAGRADHAHTLWPAMIVQDAVERWGIGR